MNFKAIYTKTRNILFCCYNNCGNLFFCHHVHGTRIWANLCIVLYCIVHSLKVALYPCSTCYRVPCSCCLSRLVSCSGNTRCRCYGNTGFRCRYTVRYEMTMVGYNIYRQNLLPPSYHCTRIYTFSFGQL